jgi:hypothetical protein
MCGHRTFRQIGRWQISHATNRLNSIAKSVCVNVSGPISMCTGSGWDRCCSGPLGVPQVAIVRPSHLMHAGFFLNEMATRPIARISALD